MKRILYFGAMLAIAALEQLPATCTVAIAGHDFGLLAADCIEDRDGSQSVACKVYSSNGLAATLAGVVFDGNTGLDLATVATTAMAQSDSPLSAAEHFAAIALPQLARSLERQRAEAWEMWHKRLGGVLARAIFAGIEGGKVALVVRMIEVSAEGMVKDLGSELIVSNSAPRVRVFCDKAAARMRSDPSLKSMEPGRLAFDLVHAAIAPDDSTGAENALDVSVIRVGKNGVKWLHVGACLDKAHTAKPHR